MVQLELRGVDADGQAVRPRGQLVARQRPLGGEVQPTAVVQGQGMGGDHHARIEAGTEVRGRPFLQNGHQNFPSRCWNLVALPSCRPPSQTDRKSKRLHSSHVDISYADFSLKYRTKYY